jgi:GntR family transcriptional regulator
MSQILSIRIDPTSEAPAVRQITDALRILLVERKLVPGTVLPSIRRVAIELGVHFNTVAEAYRQLAAENWLEVQHGRGVVVVPRSVPVVKNQKWTEHFRIRLRAMVAEMRSQGMSSDQLAIELTAMAKAVRKL